jgi:CBS domain-containing protein
MPAIPSLPLRRNAAGAALDSIAIIRLAVHVGASGGGRRVASEIFAAEVRHFVLCWPGPAAGPGRAQLGEGPMNVEAILRGKGRAVATIRPDQTIAAALAALRDRNIGALVVSDDDQRVDGIISERDIVHGLADRGGALLSLNVAEVMTRRVVTCGPADSVADLMALMTNRRIRHLPVVDDGRLVGIVSIGDLVKNRLDEIEYEANSLRSFIAGA